MLGNKITFGEFLQQVKKMPMDEKRADLPDWLELVVNKNQWNEIQPILEDYFGVPAKPQGQSPSIEARKVTESFGGIRSNQTLYRTERNGVGYLAMLWPWEDGALITVKIGQEGKKRSVPKS